MIESRSLKGKFSNSFSLFRISATKLSDVFHFLFIFLMVICIYETLSTIVTLKKKMKEDEHLVLAKSTFHSFDNEEGCNETIIPNIIHFIRFDQQEMYFSDAVCILAALRNHKPDQIYIHSDSPYFTGRYWKYLLSIPEFLQAYQIKPITVPTSIFDQTFSSDWELEHASDVTRIRILMQYGGIFLENDSYVVSKLTKYLKYEMSVAWGKNDFMGSQILIAHPEARFLKLWLESYRNNYDPTKWYYNVMERPTVFILERYPELVHRVEKKFGIDTIITERLYSTYTEKWRTNDAIHLMIDSRYFLDKDNYDVYPLYTDENILNCNSSFCFMAREAYFGHV